MVKKQKQTSQFLRAAPERLVRLLEIVNLVPPDFPLSHPAHLRIEAKVGEDMPITATIKMGKYLDEYIKTLPKELRDYLKETDLRLTWKARLEGGSLGKYESFYAARENLRVLARLAKKGVGIAQIQPNMQGSLIPSFSMIAIDDEGKTRVSKDLFAEAVEGVEATRIRECEICTRIFWAGRLDQWCCSKQCSGVLRTRRWRENYLSKYKMKRSGKQALSDEKQSHLTRQRRSVKKER